MRSRAPVLVVTTALFVCPVTAQQPVLLADINPAGSNADSEPRGFVPLNGRMYFAATTPGTGKELYSTSGTVGDATLVADVQPGAGNSYPGSLTVAGSQLFFLADGGSGSRQLWVTDGVTTRKVIHLSDVVRILSPVGSQLFFVRDSLFGQDSYWVTDGTAAGTKKILDGIVGGWDALAYGAEAVFWNDDGVNGMELWRTDGSVGGTTMIADIQPGTGSARGGDWVVAGGKVFFAADDGTTGGELWTTDGTANGTSLVTELYPGRIGSFPTDLAALGSSVVFSAFSNFSIGRAAHVSDGTAIGTMLLANVLIEPIVTSKTAGAVAGSVYVFRGRDLSGNYHPWVTDGTPAGTQQLNGLCFPDDFATIGSEVFFEAESSSTGPALWKTDGTAAGTVPVADFAPGNVGYSKTSNRKAGRLHDAAVLGSLLIFGGDDWKFGDEPCVSDGTPAGTQVIDDIWVSATTASADPAELVDIDGTTFFYATNPLTGSELWKTDGTPAGTQLVVDWLPGPESGVPGFRSGSSPNLIRVGDELFFSGRVGTANNSELCKSDGTAAGTVLVLEIYPGPTGSSPTMLGTIDDQLLFAATSPGEGRELWISDGTAAGTRIVADLVPGVDGINPSEGRVIDEILYFAATGNLWRSDGTAAGTWVLSPFYPLYGTKDPTDLIQLGDKLYFFGSVITVVQGQELWETDGTASGTQLVLRIRYGGLGIEPGEAVRSGDLLFFVAKEAGGGEELWVSDGTAAGTRALASLGLSTVPTSLTALNGGVLFAATDGAGTELWFSDGTLDGTQRIADLVPGPGSSGPSRFVATGSRAYFAARMATGGAGLYRTNGTSGGTRLVHPFRVGFGLLRPVPQTALADGRLLFIANDGTTGAELWAIDAGASVQHLGDGCSQDGFPPLLDVSDPLLGGTMRFDLYAAEASAGGALWLGLPTAQTYAGFGRNCHVYFPLNLIVELVPLVPNAMGQATFSLPLVNDPALIGAQVHVQAFQWYAINSFGLDFSNGVKLTLGP